MNRKSPGPAALLALVLTASPAWPDPLDEATKDWSADIVPADDWARVSFRDENDRPLKLYYKVSDASASGTFLFALDPSPEVEKREMSGGEAEVAVFKKNKLSDYVLKAQAPSYSGLPSTEGTVTRRDKPELSIPVVLGDWRVPPLDLSQVDLSKPAKPSALKPPVMQDHDAWYRKDAPFTAPADGDWSPAVVRRKKAQVSKPKGMARGVRSPMTAVLDPRQCLAFDDFFKKGEGAVPLTLQIFHGFTPLEIELEIARLSPAAAYDALLSSAGLDEARSALSEGKTSKAKSFIEGTRKTLRSAATQTVSDLKAGAPEDRFTPFESRFLSCRMRHLGASSQADLSSKLKTLDGLDDKDLPDAMKAFVKDWRGFSVKELEAYLRESQGLPDFPDLPDHAALDKALHARAPADASAVKKALAKPKVSAKQGRKTSDKAGDWAESLVE